MHHHEHILIGFIIVGIMAFVITLGWALRADLKEERERKAAPADLRTQATRIPLGFWIK
jgi:hypothetical protein